MLAALDCVIEGDGSASRYAAQLLSSLGAGVRCVEGAAELSPALDWAASGLMWLSGPPARGGHVLPAPLAACARGVVLALDALGVRLPADWRQASALLAERAALLGLQAQGRVSAGGSCRLLASCDGMLALNLARAEDWELLPAWLESDFAGSWDALAAQLCERPLAELLDRGRLLGLPVADARLPQDDPPWCVVRKLGDSLEAIPGKRAPRVLDLSSLWAGPLCAQLLHQLGGAVIKLESWFRPDGARAGDERFFNRMNAGKYSVALDFRRTGDVDRLRRLIDWADIVIEASRPRALRQFGIDAEQMVAARPGLSWISITGYGRSEPQANWVAFGDDAAVGAGFSALFAESGQEWAFAADALADPLTGLHAALAAWSAYCSGGGVLVSLALRDVARHVARWECPVGTEALRERVRDWRGQVDASGLANCRPRVLPANAVARALGADNNTVAAMLTC